MFFTIDVLNNFANFRGKHLCWSLFLIKLQTCLEAVEHHILGTPLFTEHLRLLLSRTTKTSDGTNAFILNAIMNYSQNHLVKSSFKSKVSRWQIQYWKLDFVRVIAIHLKSVTKYMTKSEKPCKIGQICKLFFRNFLFKLPKIHFWERLGTRFWTHPILKNS